MGYSVYLRLPRRIRSRVRPVVVVVAAQMVVGLVAGLVYWPLHAFEVTPVMAAVGVVIGLWLLTAAFGLLARLKDVGSGSGAPPPSPRGGSSGDREPRKPPPEPPRMSVRLPEPLEPTD
jgi:hypothetical protein